jgi:hypothetical protein
MRNSVGVEMSRGAPVGFGEYRRRGKPVNAVVDATTANVHTRQFQPLDVPDKTRWRTSDVIYTCEEDDCAWWAYSLEKAERHERRKSHHVMGDNT